MHTLRTALTLSFAGYEVTLPLAVTYWHRKATRDRFDGPLAGPGEPEHVEVGLVSVDRDGTKEKLPEWLVEVMTPNLEAACLEEWKAVDERDRVSMYDLRRDEALLARRPQAAE